MTTAQTGAEIFIVDNSDKDWKVCEYLKEWSDISHQFDMPDVCQVCRNQQNLLKQFKNEL